MLEVNKNKKHASVKSLLGKRLSKSYSKWSRESSFEVKTSKFNLLLALYYFVGAWVRLSGSGAGCGEHCSM